MLVSNFGWTGGGGGGSTTIYFSVTKAELDTLIGGSDLVAGATYLINNRGDNGIIVTAISANQISKEGTRRMYCPLTYQTIYNSAGNWIGVWNSTKFAGNKILAIWGGLVWKNITGSIGIAVDDVTLDASNWTVVPKGNVPQYKEMLFWIIYDYENDWIAKQWDDKGNVFGQGFAQADVTENYCDMSDWNMGTYESMYDNVCLGVYNNSNTGTIHSNSNQGVIKNNLNLGSIHGNTCTQAKSETADISDNANNGGIYSNSNNGAILSNSSVVKSILNNSNKGDIYNNANKGYISYNSNAGDIQDNTNSGAIKYNSLATGILSLSDGIGDFQNNYSDYSFDINFTELYLEVGFPIYLNAILYQDAVITYLTAKGINLDDAGSLGTATLQIGIEADDETYFPSTLISVVNGGVKVSTISSPTTAPFRRIKIEAFVNDIVSGGLNINIKTLQSN